MPESPLENINKAAIASLEAQLYVAFHDMNAYVESLLPPQQAAIYNSKLALVLELRNKISELGGTLGSPYNTTVPEVTLLAPQPKGTIQTYASYNTVAQQEILDATASIQTAAKDIEEQVQHEG